MLGDFLASWNALKILRLSKKLSYPYLIIFLSKKTVLLLYCFFLNKKSSVGSTKKLPHPVKLDRFQPFRCLWFYLSFLKSLEDYLLCTSNFIPRNLNFVITVKFHTKRALKRGTHMHTPLWNPDFVPTSKIYSLPNFKQRVFKIQKNCLILQVSNFEINQNHSKCPTNCRGTRRNSWVRRQLGGGVSTELASQGILTYVYSFENS